MEKKFIVETSARHIHVSREALDVLFGKGYELTPKKDLSQPGQFACEERVDIIGPKRELKGVSILGPTRSAVQVELSLTDARSIGVADMIESILTGRPGRVSGEMALHALEIMLAFELSAKEKRRIELSEPIRAVGEYEASVWLYAGVSIPMKVIVKAEE